MIKINYPNHPFNIKEENNKHFIFDEVRKKWVILTPEEWVRQNYIQYLIQEIKVPASLIAVEKQIRLNDITKRCDIIVYKNSKPWMIVECKEQYVAINENTLQQILGYNQQLNVHFLVLTNGNSTFVFDTKNQQLQNSIPLF